MKVELLQSREQLRRELESAPNYLLVAQQIGYLSGIKLLEHLIHRGVTEENARNMLGQMRENEDIAREIAAKRPNCLLEREE